MQTNPYALAYPPRSVPLLVRIQAIFGGFSSQFGWLFFGFGMVFVWVFGLSTAINSTYFWLNTVETASGTVASIQDTNASENEQPVMANQYIFRVERLEQEFRGESYTTGSQYSVGDEVTIEYVAANPNISRIQGTRAGTFSAWALCVVGIFPLVGLVFISVSFMQSFTGTRLLKNGKVTTGRLIDKSPTNTRINDQTVYNLTFEFTAADGRRRKAFARSHKPHNLEDEALEQIVYDPRRPANAVLVDNLPGSPDIDEFGEIHTGSVAKSLLVLILPLFVITVHGTILLFMLT